MATFAGGKIGGKHTTAIDAAEPIVKEALRRPEVTKVILGRIETGCHRGKLSVKTVDIPAGLRVTVRGNTSVQVLLIHTSDRHTTASALLAVAPQGGGKKKKRHPVARS